MIGPLKFVPPPRTMTPEDLLAHCDNARLWDPAITTAPTPDVAQAYQLQLAVRQLRRALGEPDLIQTVRVAAYLQAALLEPQEREPLTQRATRHAIGKIEANPERLLG